MTKVLDCGDFSLTVNVSFGLKFPSPAGVGESEERQRRIEMGEALAELRDTDEIREIEAQLMTRAMQHLGFDDATIRERIAERDKAIEEARQRVKARA